MLVFSHLGTPLGSAPGIDLAYLDDFASQLGEPVAEVWETIKQSARAEADRRIR
jgi:hypothetical protein